MTAGIFFRIRIGAVAAALLLAVSAGHSEEGLVHIHSVDPTIVMDMKYATSDNFMNRVLYDFDACYLQRGTALRLKAANEYLRSVGFTIKVYDCYRPLSVQREMYRDYPLKGYVANPKSGSNHNRGAAVDCTLIDEEGNEVEMPSNYDEFSERSHHAFDADEPAATHRGILKKAMTEAGFTTITKEWWHYNDRDVRDYPLIENLPDNLR